METTLSTLPVEETDLMHQFHPTLLDTSQTDMNLDLSLIFDDEESATLFRALGSWAPQVPEIAPQLDGINVAEEPTTIAPLATLISADFSPISADCSSATISNYVTPDTASDKHMSSASPYTPPTPFSHSSTPPQAPAAPPAPADVSPADVGTNQGQSEEPQSPSTPEMIWRLSRNLQEEALSLQQFYATQLQHTAQMIESHYPAPYPYPVTMHHPMNHLGHTSIQSIIEFGRVDQDGFHYARVYRPVAPPPPRRASPVSNKRELQFLEPEVPQDFVANPNNHGRWDIDLRGNRHYLNAPRTKRRRTK